jgi:hypothetical protein
MTPVSRVGHAADRKDKTKQIYVRQTERFSKTARLGETAPPRGRETDRQAGDEKGSQDGGRRIELCVA